jgi:small subunit ribosomal protein S20
MPLLRNAKKALRQSKRKAERNQMVKSKMKTMLDKAKKAASQDTVSGAFSAVDKAVKKHLIHRNKAARIKSQLSKLMSGGAVAKQVVPKSKASKAKTKAKAKSKAKKVSK